MTLASGNGMRRWGPVQNPDPPPVAETARGGWTGRKEGTPHLALALAAGMLLPSGLTVDHALLRAHARGTTR